MPRKSTAITSTAIPKKGRKDVFTVNRMNDYNFNMIGHESNALEDPDAYQPVRKKRKYNVYSKIEEISDEEISDEEISDNEDLDEDDDLESALTMAISKQTNNGIKDNEHEKQKVDVVEDQHVDADVDKNVIKKEKQICDVLDKDNLQDADDLDSSCVEK